VQASLLVSWRSLRREHEINRDCARPDISCHVFAFFPKSVGSVKFWLIIYTSVRFRDSAVGIATGYVLDDGRVGVRVSVGS
jgi:hypothetical protein